MTSIYEMIEETGPCLTSDLVAKIVERDKVSPATARKRVSRADDRVGRLFNLFPRNTIFMYLKERFGSDEYWERLTEALLNTNAAYGKALSCLIQRGGVIPEPHFQIACGAPLQLKKHLSHSTILETLVGARLVERVILPAVGPCVALIKGNDKYEVGAAALRARIIAEDIFLGGFESWAKKLGLVSYDKARRRSLFGEQPQVGRFCWDMTAPSYLAALISVGVDKPKPGFLVCDIIFGSEVSVSGILPIISKLDSLRSLKNVGRCLSFIIAESYSSDAFLLAKSKGVIPATPETLFGAEVASGFRQLIEVMAEAGQSSIDPEVLDQLFNRLAKFEGAVGNLRGALFEYLVADIVKISKSPFRLRLNEKIKGVDGKSSEIDVLAECHGSTYFIECKGYAPFSLVPDEEVKVWLTKRIPNIVKYCQSHHDWKNTPLRFEFWTTGKLSPEARQMVEKLSAEVRPEKYILSYKDASCVKAEALAAGDKKLTQTLEQHFLTHPASLPVRQKLAPPKNLSAP